MPIFSIQDGFATGSSNRINPLSGNSNTLGNTNAHFYTLNGLTVYDGSMAIDVAPGAGKKQTMTTVNGTGGQTGSAVDLIDTNTSVRSAITGAWQASTGAAATDGKYLGVAPTGTPASATGVMGIHYEDATDSEIDWHGYGDRSFNIGPGPNQTRYFTFGQNKVLIPTAPPNAAQIPWPVAGTFQYLTLVYFLSTGTSNVTITLQLDGVDTALTKTLSDTAGAATWLTPDTTTRISVSAGQLVGWKLTTGATDNGLGFTMALGFIAD